MGPALPPDIQCFTEANAELRAELAALLTEAHDLVHTVRPSLLAIYQTKLGAWELEKLKAQFRLKAINAFNTPVFRAPNTTFGSSSFGKITSQANFARVFTITCRGGCSGAQWELLPGDGRLVMAGGSPMERIPIDAGGLNPGMYILRLHQEGFVGAVSVLVD